MGFPKLYCNFISVFFSKKKVFYKFFYQIYKRHCNPRYFLFLFWTFKPENVLNLLLFSYQFKPYCCPKNVYFYQQKDKRVDFFLLVYSQF